LKGTKEMTIYRSKYVVKRGDLRKYQTVRVEYDAARIYSITMARKYGQPVTLVKVDPAIVALIEADYARVFANQIRPANTDIIGDGIKLVWFETGSLRKV